MESDPQCSLGTILFYMILVDQKKSRGLSDYINLITITFLIFRCNGKTVPCDIKGRCGQNGQRAAKEAKGPT